jgi:hypothetical protein
MQGKRSDNGNPYFEYDLMEQGKGFTVKHRQFDGLDAGTPSGQFARNAKVGEIYRFQTFTRPAQGGGNYHNIRQILGPGSFDSGAPDAPAPAPAPLSNDFDAAFDQPGPNESPVPAPAPTPGPATPQPPAAAGDGAQVPAPFGGRYIPNASANSISIERQVSVKSGIGGDRSGMLDLRVRIVEACLATGMAATMAADDDPLGLSVIDKYWQWVVGPEGTSGYIAQIAGWLEFNQGGD